MSLVFGRTQHQWVLTHHGDIPTSERYFYKMVYHKLKNIG